MLGRMILYQLSHLLNPKDIFRSWIPMVSGKASTFLSLQVYYLYRTRNNLQDPQKGSHDSHSFRVSIAGWCHPYLRDLSLAYRSDLSEVYQELQLYGWHPEGHETIPQNQRTMNA